MANAESPNQTPPWTPESGKQKYKELTTEATQLRAHPLLVLYYPPGASIHELQIQMLDKALRDSDLHRSAPLDHLDVLLHSTGGDPSAGYRLAQVIRGYAKSVEYLIPEYAYSAGTLMCLSADKIRLGDTAVLSPIDITLIIERVSDDEDEDELFADEDSAGEVETVAIDYFIQVAKQARIEIETAFRQRKWKSSKTDVESALLTEMTNQLGVLTIARYYREKNTTLEYAKELLKYMWGKGPQARSHISRILRKLVVESPSHGYTMDFHICEEVGLDVAPMDEQLSDNTRGIIKTLSKLANSRVICEMVQTNRGAMRLPHFAFFALTEQSTEHDTDNSVNPAESDGTGHGEKNGENSNAHRAPKSPAKSLA